jgi:hypothetical protein
MHNASGITIGGENGLHVVELALHRGAERCDGSDEGNGDEPNQHRVLDEVLTGILTNETSRQVLRLTFLSRTAVV